MLLFQVSGKSKDTQPSSGFLQFAESNPILGTKVTRTRAIVCFVEIRGRIDGCVHELDRKFNRDATAMMQFLRDPNDVTGKEHRSLADVVRFFGFLLIVIVWKRHIEAFHLPTRCKTLLLDLFVDCLLGCSVCDLFHLAFLGMWDLDLGIWDF
jgi:hypothetical protein